VKLAFYLCNAFAAGRATSSITQDLCFLVQLKSIQ
jgi:hypothetical protein